MQKGHHLSRHKIDQTTCPKQTKSRMRTITILAILVCTTATIAAIGDVRHRHLRGGSDVQMPLLLRRLQFGPSVGDDCSPIRGSPNPDCLEESGSGSGPELVPRDPNDNIDSPSDEDDCKRVLGQPLSPSCQKAFNHASESKDTSSIISDIVGSGPELVGGNPNSGNQQGHDGCSTTNWSWGTPQGPGCSQDNTEESDEGPALVGIDPDDARAPSLFLKVRRENLKLRRNKKKLERITKNRDYSYEYFLEEYRIQRRLLRGSRANFEGVAYTRVRVTSSGVVRPAGHESAQNLISRIQSVLQEARSDPSKLSHCKLVFSRRFGLPRFVYIEYDGYVTKIAARRLRFTDAAASPTN
jgi:hypothetical protein